MLIGITGGSASGKTTVANRVVAELNQPWVTLLSLDSFYKVLSPEESRQAYANNFNFDHPDAFDWPLAMSTLERLREGK